VKLEEMTSQRQALEKVASLIRKGSIHPEILLAAKAITRDCDARDDLCELEALYSAVKDGTDRVEWLRHGVRYVADPQPFDAFHSVKDQIRLCSSGACALDCDDQTIMIGSLAAAIGFKVGARAWGPDRSGDYVHVYAVAAVPKSGPWPKDYYGHGLDTTVPSARVGWEPDGGHILTSWLR
jgi:hypothetical protein